MTTRPNCPSIYKVFMVAANIHDNVEQPPWMTYPKRLNASTYCTTLTRILHDT